MEFSLTTGRKPFDLLVIPFLKDKSHTVSAVDSKKWAAEIHQPLATGDFKGDEGELLIVYSHNTRLALLGLGSKDKLSTETLRRAYGSLVKGSNQRKITSIKILVPSIPAMTEEGIIQGLAEGMLLANYHFIKHKHDAIQNNKPSLVQHVQFEGLSKKGFKLAEKFKVIADGVYFARDLVNQNADFVDPKHLSEIAVGIAKKHPKVKATIFDKKRIQKENMGLLLAVNRGSAIDPAFIILEYKGSAKAKEHTVLIGKGITYDTGGLNLKSSGMETMKCDMGGAAVALATVQVAAQLKLPIHLTAVVPATDNCISSQSYKPGDVYASLAGTTVEISNTDAEGRLILADALTYAEKFLKPTQLIDFATLTGGIEIALGSEVTGMMSNNDALSDLFLLASSETFERIWRLPLIEEYRDNLKSDVADIKNAGTRSASSITAAIFLQQFVKKTPWVHFDIASTAYLNEAKRYQPKHGTGIGVRLMIAFLETQL